MDDFQSALIGGLKPEDMRRSFEEFLAQAKEIRKQLGERRDLLDRYLSCLLESAYSVYIDFAPGDSMETVWELSYICQAIILRQKPLVDFPFYQQAKAYIKSHPIDCEDSLTRVALYTIALTHDYLEAEAERFLETQNKRLKDTLEHVDLNELYRQICDIVGDEDGMKNLDRLFRERFMLVTSLAGFVQQQTSNLLFELTCRDGETSKQMFQLLLDED
jgi:hypothetical protein